MLEYTISNPWRSPHSRWERACGILRRNEPAATARRDGGEGCRWIKRAMRFRAALDAAGSHRAKMRLVTDFPDVYWAHWIYEQGATADSRPLRWAIEARILARETDREICQRNGCSPDTIRAYEALFFNVRDRLDNSDYILNSVLASAVTRGLQSREYDLLWKMFGYMAGPHVLDAMISHFPNPQWAHRPEEVPSFLQDAAINVLKKKTAIAALAVPVENHTHLHLIEAFVKYVEIERTTDTAGNVQDQVQQNLQEMLQSFQFTAVDVKSAKQMPALLAGAAELRTDELLHQVLGGELEGLDSLRLMAYPPVVSGSVAPVN